MYLKSQDVPVKHRKSCAFVFKVKVLHWFSRQFVYFLSSVGKLIMPFILVPSHFSVLSSSLTFSHFIFSTTLCFCLSCSLLCEHKSYPPSTVCSDCISPCRVIRTGGVGELTCAHMPLPHPTPPPCLYFPTAPLASHHPPSQHIRLEPITDELTT